MSKNEIFKFGFFLVSFLLVIVLHSSCKEEKLLTLTTYIIPENSGEILPSSGTYESGATVIAEALNAENFIFSRWSGDINSSENPIEFQIDFDMNIVAEFTEKDSPIEDQDNDGVADSIDLCPDTEQGIPVDKNGCILRNEFDESYLAIWADEFNYQGNVDKNKWHHQVIPPQSGSWFNGELQHYTDRSVNSYVSDGSLNIVAIKENYTYENSSKGYTSARLNSKFGFKYGRVDVRAKLPKTEGTWPAIWTLGTNINEIGNYFGDSQGSVGWPKSGEIDIMEQTGWNKNETIGHFHYADQNGNYKDQGGVTQVSNTNEIYHVYSMIWTEDHIKLLVDNKEFTSLETKNLDSFNNPHYILLNVAIGGNLGGNVDPNYGDDEMVVDYVRVFQKE